MRYKTKIGEGDNGFTDIFGKRIRKDSILVLLNALIDEINGLISIVVVKEKKLSFLSEIQKANSAVMSVNAGWRISDFGRFIGMVDEFIKLNGDINVKEFVFFHRNEISSLLNLIRAKIRICEIYAWSLKKKESAIYLNRLSDLFFILAFKCEKRLKILH
ncbi:MAG: ATP:cob(I)alamin adenosyltransferase [Elusimicrobiales bacterium]